jgi:uncharacterized alkaline shock family protein YloU
MSAEPPVDPADPAVTVHVGDALVARIAAEAATGVPGVVGLRGDLAGALLELAGSVLRRRGPGAGVTARVDGRQADVTLGVVTRLGHNCRDLAQQVQRTVGEAIEAYTGLDALVRVTVVDVLLDRPVGVPAAQPAQRAVSTQSPQSPRPGAR